MKFEKLYITFSKMCFLSHELLTDQKAHNFRVNTSLCLNWNESGAKISDFVYNTPPQDFFRGILCKTTFSIKAQDVEKIGKNIQLCVVTELDRNKKRLLSITRKLQQCTIEFVICDLWPCALEIACKKGHILFTKT